MSANDSCAGCKRDRTPVITLVSLSPITSRSRKRGFHICEISRADSAKPFACQTRRSCAPQALHGRERRNFGGTYGLVVTGGSTGMVLVGTMLASTVV
jgi:hypothetical protein